MSAEGAGAAARLAPYEAPPEPVFEGAPVWVAHRVVVRKRRDGTSEVVEEVQAHWAELSRSAKEGQ